MNLLELLKPIHILAGSLTLISGLVAMTTKKGQPLHRLAGKVFFWSMAITCALGLNAAIFKPQYHLFIPISLISFYQVASGYRILYIKDLHQGLRAKPIDWAITITMTLTALAFIVIGILNLSSDAMFSIVMFSFSTIGLYCCGVDFWHYTRKPNNKMYWLSIHIFRMSHAFVASLTAFLVNNNKWFPSVPAILLLILPIAIGQPLISYTIWKYKKRGRV